MDTFDVGIVGAGVHGASVAYHLASRGVKVVIFERWTPGGGPTGRSSAICRAYYTNTFLARAARDSIAMLQNFEELTGVDAGFRRTGLLYLHPPEDDASVRASAERLNELGIVTEILDLSKLAKAYPAFDLDGIGIGAFERNAGYADPHASTDGLFRRAVRLGTAARVGVRVVGVDASEAGVTITTDDGEGTSCARLLIAAGPWTRPLVAQVGVDLPLTVERHVVATFAWGSAEPAPAHGDLIGGYYFRPEGEDLYLVGPVHAAAQVDPDAFDPEIREDETRALAAAVVRRVPHLAASEMHGGWASLYDVSPDWQPVIGQVAPNVFVDAGTSGHGFKLAPALGKHVADLVTGSLDLDPGLADFDPFRFEQGSGLSAGYRDARILG
ncbi:MAG: NAD(P)/FAD-dependent oxidoreductase [Actinomycetota bacterium]